MENTSTEKQSTPSLGLKLAKVMLQLNRLPKSGRNKEQGYPFATDADVLDTVRSKLAETGVAFMVSMLEADQQDTGQKTSKGTPMIRTVCKFEYTFIDGESGESAKSIWYGEALDYGDKGISKASTLALKYYLLKTFMISTGDLQDDPDYGSPDMGSKQQQPRQQTPSPPKSQPPAGKAPATNGTQSQPSSSTAPAPVTIDWAAIRSKMRESGWEPNNDMEKVFPAGTSGLTTEQAMALIKPKPSYGSAAK